QEAYNTTLLGLTTDLAGSYFNLRYLDSTILLLEQTVEARRKTLELSESRYKNGLGNYIDVASATLELSNTQSDYFEAVRQRGLQENVIATLVGVPASTFCLDRMPLMKDPPSIPAGLPSTLLKRRPDIAQAEREMASEHAQVGASYASL